MAECPLCGWRSAESPVGEGPNAEWYARNPAAAEYRQHFDSVHRPAPRFLRSAPTTHTGLAIEDGRATCLCGWSSEPVVTMAAALDAYNEHADG